MQHFKILNRYSNPIIQNLCTKTVQFALKINKKNKTFSQGACSYTVMHDHTNLDQNHRFYFSSRHIYALNASMHSTGDALVGGSLYMLNTTVRCVGFQVVMIGLRCRIKASD